MRIYYKLEQDGEITIVSFLGNVDQEFISNVFTNLEKEIKTNKIIIDSSSITFVNSTFIGYLFHFSELIKKIDGEIILCSINSLITDPLRLTGVLDFIKNFKTTKDSFEYFRFNSKKCVAGMS